MSPERLDFLHRWITTHPQRVNIERGILYNDDERTSMVASLDLHDYLRACLTLDDVTRWYPVHEIIAVAAGLDLCGPVRVKHINRVKVDNRPGNLAVVPCSDAVH